MTPAEFKDGIRVRLKCDVPNPKLDKRECYDVAHLPWTKGDEFRLVMVNWTLRADYKRWILEPLSVRGNPKVLRKVTGQICSMCEGWDALIDACEVIPPTAADLCYYKHTDWRHEVLQALLERGTVKAGALIRLAQELSEKESE